MALVWVAVAPIWHGQFRAFNPGDIVPDDNVAKWAYDEQGLVVRTDLEVGETVDPNGLGVAFENEVVLRSDLHIGPTPPEAPAVGTVWIDTSTTV